jgi:hypothetical protein
MDRHRIMNYILRAPINRNLSLAKQLMNPLETQQQDGGRARGTKLGVVFCFAVACALFAASLLTPQSAQVGSEGRLTAGSGLAGR